MDLLQGECFCFSLFFLRVSSRILNISFQKYKELPGPIRKRIQRDFGAKILNIVRTKWPDAEIEYEDDDNVPSC